MDAETLSDVFVKDGVSVGLVPTAIFRGKAKEADLLLSNLDIGNETDGIVRTLFNQRIEIRDPFDVFRNRRLGYNTCVVNLVQDHGLEKDMVGVGVAGIFLEKLP
jgi:hypothetical protein